MGLVTIPRQQSILFIGPPRAGKTVFFSTMVDRLIRQSMQDGTPLNCVPEGRHSHQFVQGVIKSLERQVWPKEGGATDADGKLVYSLTHKGVLYDTKYQLSCLDYAGETFNAAFGDPDLLESEVDDEQVEELKKQVNAANVVFIVVDAVRLHDGASAEIESSLFGVVEVLKKLKIWTALVLTQKDEFEGEDYEEVVRQLKDLYPSFFAALKEMRAPTHWISSVKAVTDNQGRRVPPKNYKTESDSIALLEPVVWALSLPDSCKDADGSKGTTQ